MFKKTHILIVAAALMIIMTGVVFAQDDDTVTVGSILDAAEKPLSEEQVVKVKEFKIGADMEVYMGMLDLFTTEQTAALKKALGTQPGMMGGEEQPANLFFVMLFENEGCPFTLEQIDKLKEMDMDQGPGMFEAMQEIYTEEQTEVMMNLMPQ